MPTDGDEAAVGSHAHGHEVAHADGGELAFLLVVRGEHGERLEQEAHARLALVAAAVATTDSIPGSLPRTPSRVANAVCSVGVNQLLRSRSRTVAPPTPSPMSFASFSFVRSIGGLFQTEWRIVSSNE